MSRPNYNKMYGRNEEPIKEEVNVEPIEEVNVEPVEEVNIEPVEEKIKSYDGKVIGGSLNVRKTQGGNLVSVLKDGDVVVIVDDTDTDWYKISSPVEGYVMKKFIEV